MNVAALLLRALQFVFTLIVTALVGNAIALAIGGSPAAINYAMFAAAFSWITLLYGLAGAFIESVAIPVVLLALDGLSIIFTFVAGVVLAAKLHVHSCGNDSYTHTNSILRNSTNPGQRCRELQASTAFFWFLFALYICTFIFVALGARSRGTSRAGGPSMSQV